VKNPICRPGGPLFSARLKQTVSTSDNLTPQEATNQGTADTGPDGAGLSCPGSSVVADADEKAENDGSSLPPLA
jgi:hypothetical protein